MQDIINDDKPFGGIILILSGDFRQTLAEELCFKIEEKTLKNPEAEKKAIIALADHVYPNLNNNFKVPEWMDGRAILAPTNKQQPYY